ncbi:leucine-rich repeat domain-containing protein [Candidatus Uabimicrobium sp. HlEnr_7]|uniref:leucine-rich repeat domain-containing protein n=1 Tax=Candidatus Uabimicrobium helgolandensis TaxID=3095367 RepID=UPI003558B18D
MTNFTNQTLQEIENNATYDNCTLQLYGDNQDLTGCKFKKCKFKSEVVLIYGSKNCSFQNCEFEELRIANEINATTISECNINYLNLETTKIEDKSLSFIEANNSIQKLNLHWTDLKEIPSAVLQLKTLRNLYLGNNYIKMVPENIIKLYQLELLDLTDNKVESLPNSLSQLQKLKVLGLSGNSIQQIPGIQSMKQLSNLILDHKSFSPEQQKVIREYLPSCDVFFE